MLPPLPFGQLAVATLLRLIMLSLLMHYVLFSILRCDEDIGETTKPLIVRAMLALRPDLRDRFLSLPSEQQNRIIEATWEEMRRDAHVRVRVDARELE